MVILSVFQQPESPILFEENNVKAVLDNRDLGVGSLIISERTLCWKEPGGLGFCIEYPHVSMHAISKHTDVYPTECVLVIIDGQMTMPGADVPVIENSQVNEEKEDNDDDEDDDEESEPGTSQLILVPSDVNSIHTIYNALNQCQLLNPDPEDVMDDEEEENVYEDAEDEFVSDARLNDLGAGGDTDMNHLSSQMRNHSIHTTYTYGNGDQNFDDDQFEDAD